LSQNRACGGSSNEVHCEGKTVSSLIITRINYPPDYPPDWFGSHCIST